MYTQAFHAEDSDVGPVKATLGFDPEQPSTVWLWVEGILDRYECLIERTLFANVLNSRYGRSKGVTLRIVGVHLAVTLYEDEEEEFTLHLDLSEWQRFLEEIARLTNEVRVEKELQTILSATNWDDIPRI